MRVPIVSAKRGAPVTLTGRSNTTTSSIVSPAPHRPDGPGRLVSTPVTTGADTMLPSTLWPTTFVSAWPPSDSPAAAVPPSNVIAPPFSASAPAATLIPSASASAA